MTTRPRFAVDDANTASLIDRLRTALGGSYVLTDPTAIAAHGRDWTGRFGVIPLAVARPATTDEIGDVLRACDERGVAVVPQGGRTGLVGGGVPHAPGSVVVDTSRLDWLSAVTDDGYVSAAAGVSIERLQRHAEAAGWMYGVDLASRSAATVGGTLATNAGGVRVVRYGDTRAQVVGLTAVTPDGCVISRMQGWAKDSSGYDLTRLVVGSEGTLAVVAEARLRLVMPLPVDRTTLMFGCDSFVAAVSVCDQLRQVGSPGNLLAAEFIVGDAMQLVCDRFDLPFPTKHRHRLYVLVEVADVSSVAAILDACADVVADRRLWQYRELQSEAIHAVGQGHSLDVAIPLNRLDDLVEAVSQLPLDATVYAFGHLLEGNVHIHVVGVEPEDDQVDDMVLNLVCELGGSISSEHGIGVAKTRWLHLTRSPPEIALMRRIKRAWDPNDVMNPGVLFPH